MTVVLLIIIIAIIIYLYFRERFAVITYADGESVVLPSGKYYIDQDIIFSSQDIWGLVGYEVKPFVKIPKNMRHLTQWEKNIGEIPQFKYKRFYLEV